MYILVAENVSETSGLVMSILKKLNGAGSVFRTAADNSAVLELLDKHGKPDLLLMDLVLPKVRNGFALLKTIGDKIKYDFPVVVMTGIIENRYIPRIRALGANDIVLKPIDRERFAGTVKNTIQFYKQERNKFATEIESLELVANMAEAKEGLSVRHMLNVAAYVFAIARKMGIPETECNIMSHAAKLHDLGKMYIPEYILNKTGKLTASEFEIMKVHTTQGLELVKNIEHNSLIKAAKDIILSHHENHDSSGYPYGLKGDAIPVSARIVHVADVFDSLTSKRVYKEAWPFAAAVSYIDDQTGKEFNPLAASVFLNHLKSNGFLMEGGVYGKEW